MEPRQQPQPEPATNRKRIDFSQARVPVTLVLLLLVSWMLYDAVDRELGYAAVIDAALWLLLFCVLVIPEIRKRRR